MKLPLFFGAAGEGLAEEEEDEIDDEFDEEDEDVVEEEKNSVRNLNCFNYQETIHSYFVLFMYYSF